jgi:flagellar hook-length control protein FliK
LNGQPAHAPQVAASPDSAAQSSAQSGTAVEPQHAFDAAQLRTQGNVSELKVSVQLPELGKVEVRAVSTHETTTAHITALRHDVLPVLASERAGLEESLKSHNVMLGSIGSQTQGHANGQQGQQRFNTPAQAQDAGAPEASIDAIPADTVLAGFLPDHVSISIRA